MMAEMEDVPWFHTHGDACPLQVQVGQGVEAFSRPADQRPVSFIQLLWYHC